MLESFLRGSDNAYSGYLKIEEGKNNWIEYWVAIRGNRIFLYSDECSEESGEEAIKSIELSNETRCELLQRRNYHFRFKLVLGANSLYKVKCSSAFHRQQWISQIMLASANDDGVVELNGSLTDERDGRRRTLTTESQLSSDAESLYESDLESSGDFSEASLRRLHTPESKAEDKDFTEAPAKPENRESRGLLRRLSFKATNMLRRNSNSSPRGDLSNTAETPSPSSSASPATRHSPANSPKVVKKTWNSPKSTKEGLESSKSPKRSVERSNPKAPEDSLDSSDGKLNKVFVNAAFVPSPSSSPAAVTRKRLEVLDLIDLS